MTSRFHQKVFSHYIITCHCHRWTMYHYQSWSHPSKRSAWKGPWKDLEFLCLPKNKKMAWRPLVNKWLVDQSLNQVFWSFFPLIQFAGCLTHIANFSYSVKKNQFLFSCRYPIFIYDVPWSRSKQSVFIHYVCWG